MKKTLSSVRVAIVVSRFNETVTDGMLRCCIDELVKSGVAKSNIAVERVPGAYELPFAANLMARTRRYAAVIALGCVIKGETSHDQHIATWVSVGLGQVSLATNVPTLFGVLTPNNERQAMARSRPGPLNRGGEVAKAAVEMILFSKEHR